jgi:hypothetical protein
VLRSRRDCGRFPATPPVGLTIAILVRLDVGRSLLSVFAAGCAAQSFLGFSPSVPQAFARS